MPLQITLRQETPEDYEEIFELNRIAFGQDNEANLVEALRENPAVFIPELSIVAALNNKITGHILFTRISVKDESGALHESLGLAPMAVRPEFQKKELAAG